MGLHRAATELQQHHRHTDLLLLADVAAPLGEDAHDALGEEEEVDSGEGDDAEQDGLLAGGVVLRLLPVPGAVIVPAQRRVAAVVVVVRHQRLKHAQRYCYSFTLTKVPNHKRHLSSCFPRTTRGCLAMSSVHLTFFLSCPEDAIPNPDHNCLRQIAYFGRALT